MQPKTFVDRLLTDVSNKIVSKEHIADMIFPEKKVDNFTGLIGSYGNEHLRLVNTISAGENGFPTVETVTRRTDMYSIETHGLKDFVYPADYANFNKPFDAEKDKTALVTMQLKIGREKALADVLTDTNIITQNVTLSGNAQYDKRDHEDSNPIEDFCKARETIYNKTGMVPNTAVISWLVWNKLKNHQQLLAELGYKENRKGGLTLAELQDIMEVEKIIVAKPIFNTAKKGQTDVFAPIWGRDILFYIRPSSAALAQTTLGYKFMPKGKKAFQTYKYNHEEPAGSKKIVVENYYDDVIMNPNAGYLIKDAVAQ